MSTDTLPRLVGLNYIEWLGQPGEYVLRETISRADRARMARIAKRNGCTLRSQRTASGFRVTIWPGVL